MSRHARTPHDAARRRALVAVTLSTAAVCVAVAVVQVRSDAQAVPPGPPPLEAGVDDVPEVDGAVPAPEAPDAGPATGLDPELQRRFEAAQRLAASEGVTLTLTSGWRSAAEQQALVDDAVRRYGSPAEAKRWVLPPESSAHVRGTAIDVGPTEGALWLGERAFELGLCRTYANEVWHFELLPDGAETCPDLLPDSSSGW